MVDRVGFKVQGLREKVRDLQAAGAEVEDLKNAFGKIAARGADLGRGFIRSRTGRLAASVRGNRAKAKAVVTAGRASVPYAGPINYGWPKRNIEPRQFMQKADQQLRPYAEQQLDDEIQAAIRRRGLT
jgi:hypothetical protein